ncbi:MAG: MBL fold metallo-hydrolase [Myxococcales bacterium]|nr:MBL fold metallo-hydrolase [Myxococcales bacterium]
MLFRQLFDSESSTYTYLLADEASGEAVLIDPVWEQIDRDMKLLEELGLRLVYTLETHVHADHVSASGALRERLGSKSVLSRHSGAACADVHVDDGDRLRVGSLAIEVRATPGHTNGCLSYVLQEPEPMVFSGDALLIRACGRTDFQQGDAHRLFHSITQQLFSLPDTTKVYPGHDYLGRTMTTIGEEKRCNPRLANKTEEEFVAIMEGLHLQKPKKIAVAVPANLQCGLSPTEMAAVVRAPGGATWAAAERSPTGVPEVSPAWLREHRPEVRVVDVREADEFAAGHIDGAELHPLGTVEGAAKDWDRQSKVVLVCHSGGRSGRAAIHLETLGFDHVASLRGGMVAWAAG